MATDHKFKVKNGLHTQNIEFVDSNNTHSITASMLTSDTLSFSGNAGQLFSLTDSMSGTIFSVNDVSGIPSIEVDDDGTIYLAETSGNILIGTGTDDGSTKLQVDGSIKVTGFTTSGQLDVGTQNIKIGNNYIYASGDSNSIHVNAVTSFIPDSTTTANNPDLGLSSYRWKGVYGGFVSSSGDVQADTHFTSSDSNATLSSSGSGGNVYLRPNGKSSTSGQVHISSAGQTTFLGTLKLRNNVSGDDNTIIDIDFLTDATEGASDDRAAVIRARTSGGTSTTRGGKLIFYTRGINSSNFNVPLTLEANSNSTFAGQIHLTGSSSIRSNNAIAFNAISGAAQTGLFKAVAAQTSYANSASSGMFNALNGYAVGTGTGTTVIDASRNLTNIGTISSGAITSSGGSSGRYTGLEIVNTTNAAGTETAIGLGVVSAGNAACDVKLVANRVGANSGSDFYIEQTDSSGNAQERFRISEAGTITASGNTEFNASSHLFGSSSQTTTNVTIRAQNTAGAPARATTLNFEGYESRAQGLFFKDTGLSNEEWFAGIPYNASFDRFSIGWHSNSSSQPEYTTNELFSVDTSNNVRVNNVIFLTSTTTYHQIRGRDGNTAIYLGGSSDNRNYYDSTHHRWRTDNGAVNLGEWSQAGLHIGGITAPSDKLEVTGNASIGDASNISMSATSAGQLKIKGNGYTGAIALDGSAMHIYHNSNARSLVLGTNETARLTISGTGGATFSSSLTMSSNFLLYSTGSNDAYLNADARDQGNGARMHRFNRDNANSAYLPYYENWYDGDSYHSIGVESNKWRINTGLQVAGSINFSAISQNAYVGLIPETDQNLMLGTGSGSEPRIYLKGSGNGQSDAGDIFIAAGSGGTLIFQTPPTSVGTITIQNSSPVLILDDNNATNSTNQTGYISYKLNGTENGYVGYGSSSTDLFYVAGVASVAIRAGGVNQIIASSTGVTIAGDLTVNGTTTTLNTATLDVEDKNITLNYGTGNTNTSADGAGITIQDAVSSGTDASIEWDSPTDTFNFSHGVNVTGALTSDSLVVDGTATFDTDSGTSPLQLNRLGTSTGHNQSLEMWVDDANAVFRSEQDETGRYGGFQFVGRHNGTNKARYLIESTGGDHYWYANNGNADMHYDATNRRLGIGVINPTDALDVAGTINTNSHGDSSQWNTAYGWGDHASAGYITGVTAGAGLTGGGSSGAVTVAMDWTASDSFTGTYSLVWNASNVPYTASWLQVRGSDDTLLTRNIHPDGHIRINNGGATTPSLRFNVDQNTGIFRQYEGVVSFSSDGTNVLDVGKYLKQPYGTTFQFPASTQGWRKLAKIDSRGGGRLSISFTGGNFAPNTYVIDYFKNWSTTCNLKLEQYGTETYITGVRLRTDSSDSKTYLEIYLNNASSAYDNSILVFDQRLLGYNSTTTVYTGALSAGSSSGTTHTEMDFLPQGSTFNIVNVEGATTLDSTLTVGGQSTLARPVLVNGANDNSGRAELSVEVGSGPQISLHGSQVQIGGSDMNWNSKFVYDGTTKLAGWDSDIQIFSQGSNTGSASGRDIYFSPQTSGTAAATERMRIKGATGRVGIGVSNPQYLLHLNGGATRTDVQVTLDGYGEGASDGAQFGIQTQGAYIWNYENTDLYFATNNTRRLTIDEDGQVGIGTSSPTAVLSLIDPDLTTTGQGLAGLRVHRPNAAGQYGYFDYDYGGGGVNIGSLYSGGGSSVYGTINFRQHNNSTSRTAMFIGHTGNVGIGITDPQNPLEIRTTNRLGTSFTGGTDGEGVRVTQTNYVAGNNVSLIEGSYDDSSSTPDVRIGVMFDGTGSHLKFGTSNGYGTGITNTAMIIDPIGNVGIGLDPNGGSKLDVAGSVRITSAATDQTTSADSTTIPATSGADVLRLQGSYSNGQFTTEIAKIDRSGNLPLYIRESRSTANSFTNLMRIGGHGRADGGYTAEVFGDLKVAGTMFATGTVKGDYFVANDGDSTPAGTAFPNVFNGSTRVAYFDGDATVSTWYGSGNTPYAAIDATNGVLKLYVNNTSGSWRERIQITDSNITNYVNTTVVGTVVKVDSSSDARFEADGATDNWKYLRLSTNNSANWDIATKNNELSGALQFRPGGGPTNRTYMDTSGNWVFNGRLTNTDTAEVEKVVLNSDTGGNMVLGYDGSYGITGNGRYVTLGFGGTTNGSNRIFAHNGTAAGMYFAAATGRGFHWRTNGGGVNQMVLNSVGSLGLGTDSPQKILDVITPNNDFVSFARTISPNNWTGIHFGYRENNNSYRKSAIVFERTDLTSTNAQGKVHILNGPQSGSGNCTLSDAALTIRENGAVVLPKSVLEFENGSNTITASMLSSDTLSFSGDSGQLFSLTDSMSGTIFSVNDVSGIPSIEVEDDRTIYLAESTGNVLIGTGTDNGSDKVQISGSLVASGNITAYGSASDINVKENIEVIPNAVEKVQKLEGVTFNYKKDGSRSTGLIAQQLQEVLPEVVYETTDLEGTEHLAVRYGNVVGLLVEALKEQQTQLTAQQEQINQLTNLVNKLMEK